MLLTTNRRPVVTLMAIALLLAQSVMVVHALSHAGQHRERAGHSLSLCLGCASFAGVHAGAAAGNPPSILFGATTETPADLVTGDLPDSVFRNAYRSRAPPG